MKTKHTFPAGRVMGRVTYNTSVMGTANPSAKLNPVKVRLIRRLWSWEEFTPNELAVLFKVSPQAIRNVLLGTAWWHVTSGGPLVDH